MLRNASLDFGARELLICTFLLGFGSIQHHLASFVFTQKPPHCHHSSWEPLNPTSPCRTCPRCAQAMPRSWRTPGCWQLPGAEPWAGAKWHPGPSSPAGRWQGPSTAHQAPSSASPGLPTGRGTEISLLPVKTIEKKTLTHEFLQLAEAVPAAGVVPQAPRPTLGTHCSTQHRHHPTAHPENMAEAFAFPIYIPPPTPPLPASLIISPQINWH